jgi:hypothetical protein
MAEAEVEAVREAAHRAPRVLTPAEISEAERRDTAGELRALGIPVEPPPEAGQILIVVGKMGSWKSTWAKAQVASWPDSVRVVAFDYCDEWSRLGRVSKHTRLGPLTQRMTVDELHNRPEVLDDAYLRLAVVPQGGADQRAQDFRDVISILGVDGTGRDRDLVLVVEEVWATAAACQNEYGTLATLGRHSGLALMLIAQWASAIPHMARRQAALIAAHRQEFDIDIDALTPPMPFEQAERVRHLKRGEREIWREDSAALEPKAGKKSREAAA